MTKAAGSSESSSSSSSNEDHSISDESSSTSSTSSGDGDGDGDGENLPSSPYESSDDGISSGSDGDSEGGDPPWLDENQRLASADDEGRTTKVVDGASEDLGCTTKGMASKWQPYPTLTFGLMATIFALPHSLAPSRTSFSPASDTPTRTGIDSIPPMFQSLCRSLR